MSIGERQDLPGGTRSTQANDLLRRDAARQASNSSSRTSSPALEATLAIISAEVMAEAVERLHRRTKA